MMQSLTIRVRGLLIAVFALCIGDLSAQDRPTRLPLPAAAVMVALQRAGLSVDLAHLQMPQNLTVTSSEPSLQIDGAELLSDGRLRIRLSCKDLGTCQPFFVNTAASAQGTDLASLASLRSAVSNGRQAVAVGQATLRAGTEAQLLLEDEHMRISIPVVSMDSGAVGAEVKVSSIDHKQTFRAFVVSASVVRGVLR